MRNENQEQKILIDKATRLLEREIGEIVDIHDLSKDESQWKGRSQKIESLKYQVKKLKAGNGLQGISQMQGEQSMMTNEGASMTSEASVFTGKITHAERKITQIGEKKRDDKDQLKYKIEEQKIEIDEIKLKYKGAVSRRDVLENQMKSVKTDFGMKMKMLLDKTENDDKLITMLKQEVSRLENLKGAKSAIKAQPPMNLHNEVVELKRERALLNNTVKCLEIEVEQKGQKIN